MCRFISIAVEDKEAAKRIFVGYSIEKNENIWFKREVPENFDTLWVTDTHCSCAFYSEPYDPDLEAEKIKKKFCKPKYKKRGWTEERIHREVAQILNRPKIRGGLSESLFHCLRLFTKESGHCYFHIGWYTGDQTKQRLTIEERIGLEIASEKFDANDIYENMIYTFI